MPPHQHLIAGEELARRIEAVTEARLVALLDKGSIAELLDAVPEFSRDLSESEIDALRFAILLAYGIIHPRPPQGFRPDSDRMLDRFDRYNEEMAAMKGKSMRKNFGDQITNNTRQPQVFLIGFESLHQRINKKDPQASVREEMLTLMLIAYAAAMCEITLWPPSES